ncbi:vWA domain-containing protein [Thermicanus aegyptius]|uniref:vWA domain-containing protein n=1 Tax=Thermicanus aegyptius TaxID=94009 RepID=UPI00042170C9|nr:VWA-like domain-containing protein [Thermicanus aegyptius]
MNLKLDAAIFRLLKKRPYFASAVYSLLPIESETVETMAVSETGVLYYSKNVEKWTTEEISAVLYHEILHLLQVHFVRLKEYPHEVANIAGDLEINQILREDGFQLPEIDGKEALFPEPFGFPKNLLAEEYAEWIMKNAILRNGGNQSNGTSGQEGGQSGNQSGGTSGQGGSQQGGGQSVDQGDQSSSPASTGGAKPGAGVSGSAATGRTAPWENAESEGKLTPGRLEVIRREVAHAIAEAAKGRGDVPGGLIRWVETVLEPPKVDWRLMLRNLIRSGATKSGAEDYSLQRPNRRIRTTEYLLPGMIRRRPNVAVVVDTSGSVSDRELEELLSEVQGLLKFADLSLVYADAAAYGAHKITDSSKSAFRRALKDARGGGGTDMGESAKAAAKLRPRPDVIVVLTDGLTPWPDQPLPVPMVVGIIRPNKDVWANVPAWAKKVKIE